MKKKIQNLLMVVALLLMVFPTTVFADDNSSSSGDDEHRIEISFNTGGSITTTATQDKEEGWNLFFEKFKYLITAIFAICILVCLGFFYISITRLAASGSNPMARRNAIMQLVTSIIAIAILGSGTIWFTLMYNVFG